MKRREKETIIPVGSKVAGAACIGVLETAYLQIQMFKNVRLPAAGNNHHTQALARRSHKGHKTDISTRLSLRAQA